MDFVFYAYSILFWLAIASFYFLSHNLFVVLVYLEFAALATGVILVLRSLQLDDRYFEIFSISLIALAGAEGSLAVGLLTVVNRATQSLTAEQFIALKV